MRSQSRREDVYDFKRRRIADAALTLLAGRKGPVSLRAVAAQALYQPAALYTYFPDLDAIFIHLATEQLAGLAHRLREADKPGAPAEERLRHMLNALCDASAALPLDGRLLAALTDPERRERTPSFSRSFNGRLLGALAVLGAPLADRGLSGRTLAEEAGSLAVLALGLVLAERSGLLKLLRLERAAIIDRLAAQFGSL